MDIKCLYESNSYGQIAVAFPTLNPGLTPVEKGMVVWSHHNVANSEKEQKSDRVITARLDIIGMATITILEARQIKNTGLESSMMKLIALNKDSLGDRESALEYINQAIILDPDNADNYSVYGILLIRAKEYQKAKEVLMKAIALANSQIEPDSPERFKNQRFMANANRNLAISIKGLGDIDLAVTLTYLTEQLWLASEAGGWSTKSHRIGIVKMRNQWLSMLSKA